MLAANPRLSLGWLQSTQTLCLVAVPVCEKVPDPTEFATGLSKDYCYCIEGGRCVAGRAVPLCCGRICEPFLLSPFVSGCTPPMYYCSLCLIVQQTVCNIWRSSLRFVRPPTLVHTNTGGFTHPRSPSYRFLRLPSLPSGGPVEFWPKQPCQCGGHE